MRVGVGAESEWEVGVRVSARTTRWFLGDSTRDVSRTSSPVEIRITAREDGGLMHIAVTDDGDNPPSLSDSGSGIGLANVRDRLSARFGDQGQIAYGPREEKGFSVLLTLPIIRRGC